MQAVRSLPPGEPVGPNLEAALRGAMSADRLLARYDELEEPSGTALDVSHDGSLLALSVVSSGTLEVLDAPSLPPGDYVVRLVLVKSNRGEKE